MCPDLSLENSYVAPIAGVDEVGRGPWAGPVVAAAVILDFTSIPSGINDSKKLSQKRREVVCADILASSDVGVGIASVEEIDELNILGAAKLAMVRAISELSRVPSTVLVDGNQGLDVPYECHPVVKGDSISLSIAAASIVAKVTRDRMMAELASLCPYYGWERNAGYGTQQHQNGLASHGVTIHHRKSFKPIAKLIEASIG